MTKNYLKSLNTENIWIDDNSVSKCHNCRDSFSLFNRRHRVVYVEKYIVILVVILKFIQIKN